MKKTGVLSYVLRFAATAAMAAFVLTQADAAQASPVAGRLGLGIVNSLSGATGLNVVYDGGMWHADATLALAGNGSSRADLGGHGWFHLREGSMSDFSVGGGVSWLRVDPDGPAEESSVVGIDFGFQIRVFVTANVAVGARAGLLVRTGDDDGFSLGGEPVGDFSLTYFF